VAEDKRFLTFVRRPVDSEGVGDLSLLEGVSCASGVLFENRPDSRLLDFFLSPNIVRIDKGSMSETTEQFKKR
jgi:hypothetical protein